MECVRLFVGGFPLHVSKQDITSRIMSIADVSKIDVPEPKDPSVAQNRGFVFVNCSSEQAKILQKTLGKAKWGDRVLKVEISKPSFVEKALANRDSETESVRVSSKLKVEYCVPSSLNVQVPGGKRKTFRVDFEKVENKKIKFADLGSGERYEWKPSAELSWSGSIGEGSWISSNLSKTSQSQAQSTFWVSETGENLIDESLERASKADSPSPDKDDDALNVSLNVRESHPVAEVHPSRASRLNAMPVEKKSESTPVVREITDKIPSRMIAWTGVKRFIPVSKKTEEPSDFSVLPSQVDRVPEECSESSSEESDFFGMNEASEEVRDREQPKDIGNESAKSQHVSEGLIGNDCQVMETSDIVSQDQTHQKSINSTVAEICLEQSMPNPVQTFTSSDLFMGSSSSDQILSDDAERDSSYRHLFHERDNALFAIPLDELPQNDLDIEESNIQGSNVAPEVDVEAPILEADEHASKRSATEKIPWFTDLYDMGPRAHTFCRGPGDRSAWKSFVHGPAKKIKRRLKDFRTHKKRK